MALLFIEPRLKHVVRSHHPVAELVKQSENAGLLVLGTRGRGSVKGLVLGSVSLGVLHDAHCPVAVVPSPGADRAEARTPAEHHLHLPVAPVRERL